MIEYVTSLEGVEPVDLEGFFVGWPVQPTPQRHPELLRGSEHVVLARDAESGRIVGFVNAVRALLEDRYLVDLRCDEELVPFYERLGMTRLTAMGIRTRGAIPG